MGEYRFKPAYKSLEGESSKWFKMSCDQHQKHLKRVGSMQCTSFEVDAASSPDSKLKSLSIPPDKSGITNLSSELLERTWSKAEKLLNTAGSICAAPGMQEAMCVASESGSKPHIVCKTKKGTFACDEACLAWKSQKQCSHVLAVSEEKECLEEFLIAYKRSKTTGNYTSVSTHNQPKNVGKKPGSTKRKGPSQYKKPEIETYIDPLATSSKHANSDVFEIHETLSQSHSLPAQVSDSQINQLNSPLPLHPLPGDSQISQLYMPSQFHTCHVLPAHSAASVSSSQISHVNTPRSQVHAFPAYITVNLKQTN